MQTIGQMVPAIGLVWLSFVGCDRTMAAVALCLSVGGNGAIYSGYIVSYLFVQKIEEVVNDENLQSNHMDLSPNYAGTLMGITNTMANIAGFVAPYVVGSIIEGNVILESYLCKRISNI